MQWEDQEHRQADHGLVLVDMKIAHHRDRGPEETGEDRGVLAVC